MFERPDAGSPREEGEDSLIRIDSTVFETMTVPMSGDAPRIDRWLETWARGDA